jgi:hypothetical protein
MLDRGCNVAQMLVSDEVKGCPPIGTDSKSEGRLSVSDSPFDFLT